VASQRTLNALFDAPRIYLGTPLGNLGPRRIKRPIKRLSRIKEPSSGRTAATIRQRDPTSGCPTPAATFIRPTVR